MLTITEFKMKVESGTTLVVNEDAKVELWIDSALKGSALANNISEKNGILTVLFSSLTTDVSTRSFLNEFWETITDTPNDELNIMVKVLANSFKVNGEDLNDELCYTYKAKASVAEKIKNQITSLDGLKPCEAINNQIYNINGSRAINNTQKGIIIKNGNTILIK